MPDLISKPNLPVTLVLTWVFGLLFHAGIRGRDFEVFTFEGFFFALGVYMFSEIVLLLFMFWHAATVNLVRIFRMNMSERMTADIEPDMCTFLMVDTKVFAAMKFVVAWVILYLEGHINLL